MRLHRRASGSGTPTACASATAASRCARASCSKRCRIRASSSTDAEDVTIGRAFRPLLEREYGIRFADEALADRFAFEAAYPIGRPFGFHGLFNFCRVVADGRARGARADVLRRDRAIAATRRSSLRNCDALRASGTRRPRWRSVGSRRCPTTPTRGRCSRSATRRCARRRQRDATIRVRAAAASATSIATAQSAASTPTAAASAPTAEALAQRAFDAHRRGDLDAAERGYRAVASDRLPTIRSPCTISA